MANVAQEEFPQQSGTVARNEKGNEGSVRIHVGRFKDLRWLPSHRLTILGVCQGRCVDVC
jgi:hypothetical protein